MESAAAKINQLAKARVLVVGDVMLDRYWTGKVERISPEAPVPIVSVNSTYERLGGAGNVARNITALGGVCCLMGVVGDDQTGQSVNSLSLESGIIPRLEIENDYATVVKLRVISKNQQLIRADFESVPARSSLEKLAGQLEKIVDDFDVVVFSDYGKGTLAEIESLIQHCRKAGKPVLVDPKGVNFSRYQHASMVTPNLSEFQAVSGTVSDADILRQKAMEMIEKFGFEQLLVTLSEKGMTLFQQDHDPVHFESRAKEVYDVSGAGDTVIAVMAMARGCGMNASDGVELANVAAGAVISKLGTATTSQAELMELLT